MRNRPSAVKTGSLVVLAIFLAWVGMTQVASAKGSKNYEAGSLYGYPQAPVSAEGPSTGAWEDRRGMNYRSAPPQEAWQVPWQQEEQREERAWDMLDNAVIELYPDGWRGPPRPPRPPHPPKSNPVLP